MLRRFLTVLVCLLSLCAGAQDFSGQWKGTFLDKSDANWGSSKCDYVLELEVKAKIISGYSYTYFTDGASKYYTICRVRGKVHASGKFAEITETERTKTNVPVLISNSFQTHTLYWRRDGDNQILAGNWLPAKGQNARQAGYGSTALIKRSLKSILPAARMPKPAGAITSARPAPSKKPVILAQIKKPAGNAPAPGVKIPLPAATENKPENAAEASSVKTPDSDVPGDLNDPAIRIPSIFETRVSTVLKTITVDNSIIKIELYDNGEIDGDSVSLFYNEEVLVTKKRLTDRPLVIELTVAANSVNELLMYADNLGSIPPNTALMIVRDGTKRYEVRITSDLSKSGVIRFVKENR